MLKSDWLVGWDDCEWSSRGEPQASEPVARISISTAVFLGWGETCFNPRTESIWSGNPLLERGFFSRKIGESSNEPASEWWISCQGCADLCLWTTLGSCLRIPMARCLVPSIIWWSFKKARGKPPTLCDIDINNICYINSYTIHIRRYII